MLYFIYYFNFITAYLFKYLSSLKVLLTVSSFRLLLRRRFQWLVYLYFFSFRFKFSKFIKSNELDGIWAIRNILSSEDVMYFLNKVHHLDTCSLDLLRYCGPFHLLWSKMLTCIYLRWSLTYRIILWCLSFLIMRLCIETSYDWSFTDAAESTTSFSISLALFPEGKSFLLICLFVFLPSCIIGLYGLPSILFLLREIVWLCKSHLRLRWYHD